MLTDAERNCADLEKRVDLLQTELIALQRDEVDDPGLKALREENARLKYRLSILERSVQRELSMGINMGDSGRTFTPLPILPLTEAGPITILTNWFTNSIHGAFPTIADPPVSLTVATKREFGDYQLNSAMNLSQKLSMQGQKINPRDVAQTILAKLNPPTLNIVEKCDIAGPGFINVRLSSGAVSEWVANTLVNGLKAPKQAKKLRIVVDFSSPNIAKEMHVGHLRSTIIGESICRLLEWLGHDVLRLNHIGDWGTQFGMLIAHLQSKYTNLGQQEMPSVSDLMALYKESKKRFDEDDAFNVRAHECVVKLQQHDPAYISLWQRICERSREEFQKIYNRLGVTLIERGESFYQDRMKSVVEELDANGEGRKVMFVPEADSTVPLTVVKSDGGYTYDTSDMAALKQRLFEEKADWLLYVVDAGQSLHFQTLFAAARKAGWYNPQLNRVVHIGFGVVLGDDKKKLKTREGKSIRLVELLDEGLRRCEAKLKERGRDKVLSPQELADAQKNVAYGCIKYADLSHSRQNDYVFSFDRMLDDKGNTAAYLLYAYTRIRSIARNAGVSRSKLVDEARKGVNLTHEHELRLAKMLLRFEDTVVDVLVEFHLHILCDYLYELSTVFTTFYDNCYCIEKDSTGKVTKVNMERLALCEVTGDVFAQCFSILGINPLEKM